MSKRAEQLVYFPNLNSLRFIAAFLVIVHHIEQIKNSFGIPSYWHIQFFGEAGHLGVTLFFVLSGFLISYLLFAELRVTKTISIKNFYIRRILRIWPLYYLVILAALFIFPHIEFLKFPGEGYSDQGWKIFLYIFFLPNLALTAFYGLPYASQAWSIGVEEQFYLFWPVFIRYVKNKWVFMISVIGIYLLARFVTAYYSSDKFISAVSDFLQWTPFDAMAIGGLFALICFSDESFALNAKRIIFNTYVQWSVLAGTIIFVGMGYRFPYINHDVYAVFFGIIISNMAMNTKRVIDLEKKWMNYLGKISYGLYMYHGLAIVVVLKILAQYGSLYNYILYPASIGLTILMSSLSYHYFEKYFISLKVKFSALITGENAHEL